MNTAGYPDYSLNGIIPVNSGQPDGLGCFWFLVGEIAGWDSPDMRVTMVTKIGNTPLAQGEIPADLHYRGRSLQFKLIAECPSEAVRESARLLLAGALDLTASAGTFYANEAVPKLLSVYRSGNANQGKLTMTDGGQSIPKAASMVFSRSFTDGVTTGSSNVVSSATADFRPQDLGFPVVGPNVPAGAVVAAVISSTTIHLNVPASGSGTGLTLTVGGVPGFAVGTLTWPLNAEVELYAGDPLKYAQSPVTTAFTSGSASVTNEGNTQDQKAVITLDTTGVAAGPLSITVGSQAPFTLMVPDVPSGAPALSDFPAELVIDLLGRTIVDGSGNNYYYLRDQNTPWPTFPPGTSDVVLSETLSGSVELTSAWI